MVKCPMEISEDQWIQSTKIRFINGSPEIIGGWMKEETLR